MNYNTFITATTCGRAVSEIVQLYKIRQIEKDYPVEVQKKLSGYKTSLAVIAVADLFFTTLRLSGCAIYPYSEWVMLIPRLSVLFTPERSFLKSDDFSTYRKKIDEVDCCQLFTIARKIIPSAISIIFPRVGRYTDYAATGLEMAIRTLFLIPTKN